MRSGENRPDPDALLGRIQAQEVRAHRGHLKIFFGSCAGVGKTYAMLSAAHEHMLDGMQVVVGLVETHARPETEKLLDGLTILPTLTIQHRGVDIREFDLDAALAAKPQLLLLDELAHTNGPGLRHPKRWNDVEELLDAGIDVYTTLNVQHLESLNDLVAGITGVWVKELVPDRIFDMADDITLVDIPSDELLKRLHEGKVYLAPGAQARAAENFFKKSNLIALRELALRRTAERVDAQMDDYRVQEGMRDQQPVAEKVMVCIGPDALSAKLVRSARRMATALKSPWVAAYVENARHYRLNQRSRRAVEGVMRSVERNGGKSVVLSGNNAAEELIAYALAQGVTKIIVGKPVSSRMREFVIGSLAENLIRRSGAIDVYVITGQPGRREEQTFLPHVKFNAALYMWGLATVTLCTLLARLLDPYLEPIDQVMIYLMGVVVVAARFGQGPSFLFSLIAVTSFNFFFIEPLHALNIQQRSYWMTFLVMTVTSVVISAQATRLRQQAVFARKRERDTQMFFALTRDISATRGHQNIASVAARQLKDVFGCSVLIWVRGPDGALFKIAGDDMPETVKEQSVVQWCLDHGQPSGRGTHTMPTAAGMYFPLSTSDKRTGVMGVVPAQEERSFNPDEVILLETFASLISSALERATAAESAEQARVETEGEKLRNILLSSVSHDLRTPLASITSSSSSIVYEGEQMPRETVRELALSINREAARLSRIVTNLLDVTSLQSGAVALNRQPYFIEELIGSALLRLEAALTKHRVVADAEPNLPMVTIDGLLIEQVLINLLENAVQHTPTGSEIRIVARREPAHLHVTVVDSGPGIAPGKEEAIFDKFYIPADNKPAGLGLAICRGIITAHGGRIWGENTSESGAAFHFTLPVPYYFNSPEDTVEDDL